MSQVVSFSNYKPAARYDALPWTHVKVEEAASADGPWTLIDTLTLSPVDSDPSKPLSRNLTVENASNTLDLWYRLTTTDGTGAVGRPSDPIQNLAPLTSTDPTLYVQPEQLKATLSAKDSNVDTTYLDADLLASCKSASRAVETLTDRGPFYTAAEDTRTYTARGPLTIVVDDVTVVTAVLVDRDDDGEYEITLAAGTDYVLIPENAAAKGRPYEAIRLRQAKSYLMPIGVPGGVKITAEFGWPEVPSQIVDAATIIAAKLFKRKREAPFSIIGVGLDNMAVRIGRYDSEVQMLLEPFDRHLWVA